MVLYNCPLHIGLNIFITPKGGPYLHQVVTPHFPLPSGLKATCLFSVCRDLLILDIL